MQWLSSHFHFATFLQRIQRSAYFIRAVLGVVKLRLKKQRVGIGMEMHVSKSAELKRFTKQ
jgi:hypothetical protein